MSHPHPIVDVAVAVITRADGSFLLARRPAGKPYAGYWEFPGGKVNAGESRRHALERELLEELAIQAQHA
jgi:8-oxo-dGTP diphosphatase